MGVLIPEEMKLPQCPYCYSGEVIRDMDADKLVCNVCNKAVIEHKVGHLLGIPITTIVNDVALMKEPKEKKTGGLVR